MREKPERLPYKALSTVPAQGRCELVSVFTFLFPLLHPTSITVLVLSGFKPLLTFMFTTGVIKYYLVKNNPQPKVTSRNWGDLREKKKIIPDRASRSVVSRDIPVFVFCFLILWTISERSKLETKRIKEVEKQSLQLEKAQR